MLFKKKVLLIISDLEYGGAQRQVIELANNMDMNRYNIHICSLSNYIPLATKFTRRDTRLHILQKYGKYDLTLILRLIKLIKKLKVQIIHTFLFDLDIFGRIAGKMAGVQGIINSERNTNYVINKKNMLAYKLTKKFATLVIANSKSGAEFYNRYYEFPISQIRVVHNGVDINRFIPEDGSALRKKLNISNQTRLVGIFGSFKPQKNHIILLKAFKEILRELKISNY